MSKFMIPNNMRNCLLIALLLISFYKLSGQTILLDPPEIYIGTSHGATASMILFKPDIDQNMIFGYNGGIMARYVTEKNTGLQIELNFSQRGWGESDGKYSRQLNYIELPLLTHIYLGKKTRFIFNLGPKISYLLNETVLYDNTENSTSPQHINKIQNPFEYGVTAGIGIQFNLLKQYFFLEARGNYSLSPVFSNKKPNYFNFSNNINIALNLGWMMRINKEK